MTSNSAPNFLEPPLPTQAPPLIRFEGDGYDFRRPIMSTSVAGPSYRATPVIDLTEEDSDPATSFVSSRQLPPLPFSANPGQQTSFDELFQHPSTSNRRPTMESADNESVFGRFGGTSSRTAAGSEMDDALQREDSDDSDVVFVGEREIRPSNNDRRDRASRTEEAARWRPIAPQGVPVRQQSGMGGLRDLISENTIGFFRNAARMGVIPHLQGLGFGLAGGHQFAFGLDRTRQNQHNANQPEPEFEIMADRHIRHAGPQNFPLRMDFEAQGFELVNDDDAAYRGPTTRSRNESPPYKAPSAPPEGFTRRLEEDAVVVCPNCYEELGRRDYDDLKKQVWVVKACGHVYCGECTKNRFISKGKGAASTGKHPTFKKCVVDDCEKPVSSKTAMLQIYL